MYSKKFFRSYLFENSQHKIQVNLKTRTSVSKASSTAKLLLSNFPNLYSPRTMPSSQRLCRSLSNVQGLINRESREGKEMAQCFFWPWPRSRRHLDGKKEVKAREGGRVEKFARNSSFSRVSHAAFSRLLVSLLHRLNADTVNTLSCCATKGATSGHWKRRSIQISTFSMERLFTVALLWIVSVV